MAVTNPATRKLTAYAGNTFNFLFTFTDGNNPIDLSADYQSIRYIVFENGNKDSPTVELSTGDGLVITNTNELSGKETAAQTEASDGKLLYWELQFTLSNGDTEAYLKGRRITNSYRSDGEESADLNVTVDQVTNSVTISEATNSAAAAAGYATDAEGYRDEALSAKQSVDTSEQTVTSLASQVSDDKDTVTTLKESVDSSQSTVESVASNIQAQRIQDAAFYYNQHLALKDMSLANLPIPTALIPPQPNLAHPLLNFTRSSKKWVWGPDGNLKEIAENEIPYDYDPVTGVYKGVLIEEQRTNYILDSRDMTTGNWVSTTLVTRNQVGVDGVPNTACLLEDNSTGTFEFAYQEVAVPSDNNTHCVSVFVKKDDNASRYVGVSGSFKGGAEELNYNCQLNTKTGDITHRNDASNTDIFIDDYGDWWRVYILATNNETGNNILRIQIWPSASTSFGESQGSATGSAIVDQAQVEQGPFPTSPIITEGSTVTRSADIADFTDLSWYNQSEGTFVVEGYSELDNVPEYIRGRGAGYLEIRPRGARHYDGSNAISSTGVSNDSGLHKLAFGLGETQSLAIDGEITDSEPSSLDYGAITKIGIGNDPSGGAHDQSQVWLKSLLYYPRRLSNSQLQALTQ